MDLEIRDRGGPGVLGQYTRSLLTRSDQRPGQKAASCARLADGADGADREPEATSHAVMSR